jgi:hypothetical protein
MLHFKPEGLFRLFPSHEDDLEQGLVYIEDFLLNFGVMLL